MDTNFHSAIEISGQLKDSAKEDGFYVPNEHNSLILTAEAKFKSFTSEEIHGRNITRKPVNR